MDMEELYVIAHELNKKLKLELVNKLIFETTVSLYKIQELEAELSVLKCDLALITAQRDNCRKKLDKLS